MARRSDHSREEIRLLALEAAEKIVAEGGHRALSARKVASAIGYTVGTLYLVFRNLDDLLLQLNGRTLDRLHDWLGERRGPAASGKAALFALAEAYIEFAETQTARWSMLFELPVDNGDELPEWYQQKLSQVFGLVEEVLLASAKVQDPQRVCQAARVLWASVHGICILKIRQRLDLAGGQSTGEMARMLIDNFLDGMGE